jgi:hypothetical protein
MRGRNERGYPWGRTSIPVEIAVVEVIVGAQRVRAAKKLPSWNDPENIPSPKPSGAPMSKLQSDRNGEPAAENDQQGKIRGSGQL